MEEFEELLYASEQNQNCLRELFFTNFKENGDYADTLVNIVKYLINDSDEFDYILDNYDNVTKNNLNHMIIANFIELTNYRAKNKVPIDNVRANLLKSITSSDINKGLINILEINFGQFTRILNDVFLYFWHLSPIYSYNAVKSMYKDKDNIAEKLYSIYPLTMVEHMMMTEVTFPEKEYLLYTLIECMINSTERSIFREGGYPVPAPGYIEDIVSRLETCNGTNSFLPNLHEEILNEFNEKVGITSGKNYDKILMLEIFLSTIQAKQEEMMPIEEDEKSMAEELNKMDLTIDNISNFYDNNEQKIVSSLINNWYKFFDDYSVILADTKEFNEVKEKEIKLAKKRFK